MSLGAAHGSSTEVMALWPEAIGRNTASAWNQYLYP
jgi:hypothetical protein